MVFTVITYFRTAINLACKRKQHTRMLDNHSTMQTNKKIQDAYSRCHRHRTEKICLCSACPFKKLKNKCRAQLALVNTLLIAVVGLNFPWINKIFYITLSGLNGLLFPACSSEVPTDTFICCVCSLFLNISPFGSGALPRLPRLPSLSVHTYLRITFFSLGSVSSSLRSSQALWLLTALLPFSFLSHSSSAISTSPLSGCLCECQAEGVPGVTLWVMSS